jgi:hypothetical protein
VHVFLSHNHRDKSIAVQLAAQLRLVGADVWLDDWEIRPGDSIPDKVSAALDVVDTVIVLWSENAARSRWVEAELATALDRRLADGGLRVIPVVLDDTPLPALLRPLKRLAVNDDAGVIDVARAIAGIDSDTAFLQAVQSTIDEAGLEIEYFQGYGPLVACPSCGAPASELEGWEAVNEERDDLYAGARCQRCGWEGGGEL